MNKKTFLKSTLDAGVRAACLFYLNSFCLSIFATKLSAEYFMHFFALAPIVFTFIYFLLLRREKENKKIVFFSLSSTVLFVLFIVVFFAVNIAFPITIFPQKETNNVDGIIILFNTITFTLVSFVLRLIVFVTLLVKNSRRKTDKNKTGDG